MPREIATQVLGAVQRWIDRDQGLTDMLQKKHGLDDLAALSLASRDQALVFLSDLLRHAADADEGPTPIS